MAYLLPLATVLVTDGSVKVGQGTRTVYGDGMSEITDSQGVRLNVILQSSPAKCKKCQKKNIEQVVYLIFKLKLLDKWGKCILLFIIGSVIDLYFRFN